MPRRTAMKLVLCLLAGFVVNFAIAAAAGLRPLPGKPGWGCGFPSEGGKCSITWHDGGMGRTPFSAGGDLPSRAGPGAFKAGSEL